MTERFDTLEELLGDPIVQLVMARDRVRPEDLRRLLERARREEPSTPPHIIAATSRPNANRCCA